MNIESANPEKYYYKTIGQEPDVFCTQKCNSLNVPTKGTHIGSVSCQECKCCISYDSDNNNWIKCSDLKNALGNNNVI